MRRMVDASLGQVTGLLSDSSSDKGIHKTASTPKSVTNNSGDVSRHPSGDKDELDVKTFKFLMRGDEKKCREQLIDGKFKCEMREWDLGGWWFRQQETD